MANDRRLELQTELETLLASADHPDLVGEDIGEHVSFQPDEESQIAYPHIVYSRDPAWKLKADNLDYLRMEHYTVTYIDREPDNPVFDILEARQYTSHERSFVADGLHHDVFDLYH